MFIEIKQTVEILLKMFAVFFVVFGCIGQLQVFAQYSNDWKLYRLKGKPRIIEESKTAYSTDGKSKISSKLNQISNYGFDGKLTQSVLFVYQENKSYYQRTRSYFDENGRKYRNESYKSSLINLENFFLPDFQEIEIAAFNPEVKETLLQTIESTFDKKGNIIRLSVTDENQKTNVTTIVDGYNEKGEEITVYYENGVLSFESSRVIKKNGRQIVDIIYENSILVSKSILNYDKKHRLIYSEQFRLKAVPNEKDFNEIIEAKTIEKINGNKRKSELFFYNEAGILATEILRTYKNNLEETSAFYKYNSDKTPDDKSKRELINESKTTYTFDKLKNWIESVTYKRGKPDGNFVASYGKVRRIVYY
jgi:methylmalonyl-CoA mutase cobalamin-binding subunit